MALGSSRTGMRVALGIARAIPPSVAYPVTRLVADRLAANRESELGRAARVNQFVVSGGALTGAALEAAARRNVREMARTLYDLYHVIGHRETERALVVRDEVYEAFLERHGRGEPTVWVGVHYGNFDLMGRVLGYEGWNPQVLSVPNPHGGYEWQNEMRETAGFEVTPISLDSLKQAARRLEAGGSILSGLDFPMPEPDKVRPRFFGHPSSLPLLHVRLAMRAGVPVIALTAPRTPDGRYRLAMSEPIVMEGDHNDPEALCANAERCLAPVERWIAELPTLWCMPHVVWPDVELPE